MEKLALLTSSIAAICVGSAAFATTLPVGPITTLTEFSQACPTSNLTFTAVSNIPGSEGVINGKNSAGDYFYSRANQGSGFSKFVRQPQTLKSNPVAGEPVAIETPLNPRNTINGYGIIYSDGVINCLYTYTSINNITTYLMLQYNPNV